MPTRYTGSLVRGGGLTCRLPGKRCHGMSTGVDTRRRHRNPYCRLNLSRVSTVRRGSLRLHGQRSRCRNGYPRRTVDTYPESKAGVGFAVSTPPVDTCRHRAIRAIWEGPAKSMALAP